MFSYSETKFETLSHLLKKKLVSYFIEAGVIKSTVVTLSKTDETSVVMIHKQCINGHILPLVICFKKKKNL